MPSALHEVLLELFRYRPSLAVELLSDTLGLDVPAYQYARLDPADLTDVVPTEFRADRVVVCRDGDDDGDGSVLAVVVEVQLEPDTDKRWSWPAYVATLRSRLKCPTELLVICPRPATARWCSESIPLGVSGSYLVVEVMSDALGTIEKGRATRYLELVLAALPHAARSHLEELMETGTFTYQSEFTERLRNEGRVEGRDEGRVETKAAAVLTVLDAAGDAVPAAARARITGCTDLALLDTWLRRAVTARSVDDLFA